MRRDNDKRIYVSDDTRDVVYLKNVVEASGDPDIQVGAHTYYHDWINDPRDWVKNNVLYHYPDLHHDSLTIGRFCSLACQSKFLMPIAQHTKQALTTYPFALAQAHWEVEPPEGWELLDTTNNIRGKGPTVVGNDVWLGYDCVIMPGVTIGDGAAVGTRSVVTRDVPPYTVVAGAPARPIYKRYDDATIARLLEIRWWDWSDEEIARVLPEMITGDLSGLTQKRWLLTAVDEVVKRLLAYRQKHQTSQKSWPHAAARVRQVDLARKTQRAPKQAGQHTRIRDDLWKVW